jgi:hypothetical protein
VSVPDLSFKTGSKGNILLRLPFLIFPYSGEYFRLMAFTCNHGPTENSYVNKTNPKRKESLCLGDTHGSGYIQPCLRKY